MRIIDELCLVRDSRDRSKVALPKAQEGSLAGRVGIPTVGFDDVALERQIPRVGLRLLDCYHRGAREIKIHPDVSGTCIDSIDNGAN